MPTIELQEDLFEDRLTGTYGDLNLMYTPDHNVKDWSVLTISRSKGKDTEYYHIEPEYPHEGIWYFIKHYCDKYNIECDL